MKMWAGRTSGEVDSQVNDFNSSIAFDKRLFQEDICGSIAHAHMLAHVKILTSADVNQIVTGLESILHDIQAGKLAFDPNAEDIHMFIEAELTARIGDAGKKLHTARSRNDQVALDIKMYLKREIIEIIPLVKELTGVLCEIAKKHTSTVMPGYTHLQRAQPITFAHHLMAYSEMLLRDITRFTDCAKRLDYLPLGAGALAGTTFDIDRHFVAKELGFKHVCANSLDAVSDRDYCLELSSVLSICMVHLSRLSEEVIFWTSWECKFVELDDKYSTGSSIMPQKKNPDIAELIRGKCARSIGNMTTLYTLMKGLPLAYNKDMQEDKEAIFDLIDTAKLCIKTLTPMLATMKVLDKNMYQAAAGGFINATDCADYLAKKGVPFRDAYKATGELVAYCIEHNMTLETLPLTIYQKVNKQYKEDIFDAINLNTCVQKRKVYGGPASQTVIAHIKQVEEQLHD